jgi:hypothetical protein
MRRQEVSRLSETHAHDAEVHQHEHTHVTHYLQHGREWEHLMATHDHRHNHPGVSHAHAPHVDPGKEHAREAHIHDHERPDQSPG